MRMKFLYFITFCLVLIYIAESQDQKSKDEEEQLIQLESRIEKKFQPVLDECKTENPETNETDIINKCHKDKLKAAWDECKQAEGIKRDCVRTKLNLKTTEMTRLTNVERKERVIIKLINENKQAEVDVAINKCETNLDKDYWFCWLQQLAAGPCTEFDPVLQKIIEFREKMQQATGK